MDNIPELIEFMNPKQRADVKTVTMIEVLGLTGSSLGRQLLLASDEMLAALYLLTFDPVLIIAKDAVLSMINLSGDEAGAIRIYETSKTFEPKFEIVQEAIKGIIDENSAMADAWTMLLSNLTRVERLVGEILDEMEKDEKTMANLTKAYARLDYNKKKERLHYLGPIFCNLTQTIRGRAIVCCPKYNLLERILPFVSYPDSLIRRGGTIGILKNICFDPIYHDVFLNERDSILHCLLYPLAGPEEFSDEENDMFPIELQFLGNDKKREDDPDLRKMLLESLLQLCATKKYREFLRSKGTYEILREYHKWEATVGRNKAALLACENVVDILIKREDEIGIDNLKEVEVPTDITQKFAEEDEASPKD